MFQNFEEWIAKFWSNRNRFAKAFAVPLIFLLWLLCAAGSLICFVVCLFATVPILGAPLFVYSMFFPLIALVSCGKSMAEETRKSKDSPRKKEGEPSIEILVKQPKPSNRKIEVNTNFWCLDNSVRSHLLLQQCCNHLAASVRLNCSKS